MMTVKHLNPLDFPLSGTRLIEASAGTGKTYTIAALYVRLILGHGQEPTEVGRVLLPPDILVVTFTDAATKELRERIRARLTQAVNYFRGQPVEHDDFLVALRASYDSGDWPVCARKLELAANWMDESAVYTIHGWCNRMLQQHAFDSGSLFRQEVNTDDTELLNEVVRDYWRTFFYPLTDIACQAALKLAASPEELTLLLKSLLFETEALGLECVDGDIATVFKNWEDWEQKRRHLELEARRLWLTHQADIENLLNKALGDKCLNGNKYAPATFHKKLAALDEWAQFGRYIKIDDLEKFGQGKLQSGFIKAHEDKAGQLTHPAFMAIDVLVAHVLDELEVSERIMLHAIHWIRHRYETKKQQAARMTFDDMLTRLDKALQGDNGERLANLIRQQYPIALIDEFQDTDPIQYRIFASLYPVKTDNVLGCFMIGDPKQAIYSFRGADIYTYLKAHQMTAGNHYTLGTNFRSTKALVSAVNQVFLEGDKQAEGAFLFKNANQNPLPFLSVDAKGRDDTWVVKNEPASALTLWHWQASESVGMPEYRANMAEVTASEIVRLLNLASQEQAGFKSSTGVLKALQPSDIAILVRSGTEAKVIRNALASRSLRSVYLSERDSIYATGEASDLLIWLKALAAPRNERKVRAALSTSTLGWSYQTLQQLTLDELGWEEQIERFLGYQQRWQQDGILPTLRQLMNDYGLPIRLIPENNGERCLTNLLHLAELLQQASSQLEGEQALIRFLAEEIAASEKAAEESVIRLESDANLIKIITIHKSKGLEYPLVFLPFICSFREVNGRNSRYYRYHDENQSLSIDLSKNDDIKKISDKERLQEDLRLLYVAITRAQYACWLGIAPIKSGNGKDSQLDKSAIGYLLGWEPKIAVNALAAKLEQFKGGCEAIAITELPEANQVCYVPKQQQETLDAPRSSVAKIADNWWIASYSALKIESDQLIQSEQLRSLSVYETASDDKQSDEADVLFTSLAAPLTGIHGLPRGAGPGILIHELLDQCGQQGFKTMQAAPDLCLQLIDKIFSHKMWADKRDIITTALSQWLNMPLLLGEEVSLANLELDDYQTELEFLLGAEDVNILDVDQLMTQYIFVGKPRPRLMPTQLNGLLKGFIDLVFVYKQQYYLIDYKFNGLGNNDDAYTQEVMEAAMLTKRYDLQYALYLLALHRLLKVRLGENYDYDIHVGGAFYLFLRGSNSLLGGRMFDKPSKVLIEELDQLFCNSINKREEL